MSPAAILEAQGLHAYYGTSHILHGIDFTVRQGEAIGLMGRNGMGKTTLIRTLLGLVPARRGAVRVDGKDMTQAAPHRIARLGIAYVPEGRGIFGTTEALAIKPGLRVFAVSALRGEGMDALAAYFVEALARLRSAGA